MKKAARSKRCRRIVRHLLEEALKAYIAVPQASKADTSFSKA